MNNRVNLIYVFKIRSIHSERYAPIGITSVPVLNERKLIAQSLVIRVSMRFNGQAWQRRLTPSVPYGGKFRM
jgi:hypothetical protein